jgi:hypothetical protein
MIMGKNVAWNPLEIVKLIIDHTFTTLENVTLLDDFFKHILGLTIIAWMSAWKQVTSFFIMLN